MDLAHEILRACVRVLDEGRSGALATIIQGTPPWVAGEKMLLGNDGLKLGNLGDEQLAARTLVYAREALATGQSRRVTYLRRNSEFVEVPAGEPGDVDVFIEILQSSPTLLLIGAGHIGLALIQLAKMLKWRIVAVDDRPDFITAARLPDADERILVGYEPTREILDRMPLKITPSTFIVVATWGWDEPALKQILGSPAAYIGFVASARKSIIIFRELLKEGISPEALARVRVPTGLDLGAETPMEIALSIMAEMLMVQRHATGEPLIQQKGSGILRQSKKDIQS